MYQPNLEYVIELHRQEILKEAEQAQRTRFRIHRPGLFSRAMIDLANWMIVTGRELRCRYEIPAATRGSFARVGKGMRI